MQRNIFQKKRLYVIIAILAVVSGVGFFAPRFVAKNEPIPTFALPPQITLTKKVVVEKPKTVWPVPDIEKMKTHGCVADGLLSGYNRTSKDVKVARESNCYFFSRAIETWLDAPNFHKAQEIIDKIGRDDVIYGMFIAEAINKKENYVYYDQNRRFDFSEMCRKNSKNFWGEHTCKPSFDEEEYRAYIRQITREAMDIGIRSFLFGQIYHQEEDIDHPWAPVIIEEMRAYAKENDIHIVIGAQTNDIDDEEYLALFDFIEGGVGLHVDGTVEDGPCFSRWHDGKNGWCWALLWHE